MNFFKNKHNYTELYNKIISLTREKFFYTEINLNDSVITRLYLTYLHLGFILKVLQKKNFDKKKTQEIYDIFFKNIELDFRQMGHGDVAVNKKMKELVRLFNEILLYCETWDKTELNHKIKYLNGLFKENDKKNINIDKLLVYIDNFVVNIELMSLNLLLKGIIKIKK